MYELKNVSKLYKKRNETVKALNAVSLEIPQNDFVAIQGSTGGGKSTLLQMLGGLDTPSSGTISFNGVDLSSGGGKLDDFRARKLGFVFQGFNLIPTLTALQNVETALVPLGVSSQERKLRASEELEKVGLAGRLSHRPAELSGGQQQRVAIARALVSKPEVVLADEPTGNLDEETRDEIMNLLMRLWREENITLVVVTHDKAVASLANHQVRLHQGEIR